METAGLAIGILAFTGSILKGYKTVSDFISTCKDFESDMRDIAARLHDENARTLQIRDLLFSRKRSQNGISLFDQLDERVQRQLYSLFDRFAVSILQYTQLDSQYALNVDETSGAGDALLSDAMRALLVDGRLQTRVPP